jgi:hypothetical protein
MDLEKLIAELYEERARLDAAIAALERAIAGGHKRRGRPPKWLAKAREGGASKEPKPGGEEKGEAEKQ